MNLIVSRSQKSAETGPSSPSSPLAQRSDGTRTEYAAITAKGVTIRTFDERKAAVKWLTEPDEETGVTKLASYPGATVREVIYPPPISRTVWREPKLRLVESA